MTGRQSGRRRKLVTGASLLIAILVVAGLALFASSLAQPGVPELEMISYDSGEYPAGTELSLDELAGNGSPLVLNFWAALCPPCRQEMPGFQRVHEELGEEFVLLGVDIGPFIGLGSNEQARAFLEEYGIEYLTAYSADDKPLRDFEVRGMPTTIFFDGDGNIVKKHTGYLPEEQLREELRALLERS